MRFLYLNFLGPVIIVIMFTYELSGSIVVNLGVSKEIWEIVRLCIVIGFVGVKTVIFREEL